MSSLFKRLTWRVRLWFWKRRDWPEALPHKRPAYSKTEMNALIASLRQHPGFQYLVACSENARHNCERERQALIRTIPNKVRSEHLARRLFALQEAIFWTGWLQYRVLQAEKALIHDTADEQSNDL